MKPLSPAEPAFFDLAGASVYLGGAWSVRTLRRLIAVGEIPYYRRGRGKILLRRVDLDQYLSQHRQVGVDLDAVANEVVAELGMGGRR
jgi:excisionase family DNA binding protein